VAAVIRDVRSHGLALDGAKSPSSLVHIGSGLPFFCTVSSVATTDIAYFPPPNPLWLIFVALALAYYSPLLQWYCMEEHEVPLSYKYESLL